MIKTSKTFRIKKDWYGLGYTIQVPSQSFQFDHDQAVEAMMPKLKGSAKKSWNDYGYYAKTTGWPGDVEHCIKRI